MATAKKLEITPDTNLDSLTDEQLEQLASSARAELAKLEMAANSARVDADSALAAYEGNPNSKSLERSTIAATKARNAQAALEEAKTRLAPHLGCGSLLEQRRHVEQVRKRGEALSAELDKAIDRILDAADQIHDARLVIERIAGPGEAGVRSGASPDGELAALHRDPAAKKSVMVRLHSEVRQQIAARIRQRLGAWARDADPSAPAGDDAWDAFGSAAAPMLRWRVDEWVSHMQGGGLI